MADSKTLTDIDYMALANFRHAIRRFLAFSEGKAGEAGLTPQQHQALLFIRAAPPGAATIGYVAERLVLKPHSATGLIHRLETLGLLTRLTSGNDRRRTVLKLTEKARSILTSLSTVHREEIKRLQPALQAVLKHFC